MKILENLIEIEKNISMFKIYKKRLLSENKRKRETDREGGRDRGRVR